MFLNCIDRFGRQNEKQNNNKQRKTKENKQIKNGNNGTHHEPLSKERIGRRSPTR